MSTTLDLNELVLLQGGHGSRDEGVCFNEAAAWRAGEGHTDMPKCVSPVLRAFTMRLNDRWGDEDRQKLIPYIDRVIGTAGDGQDKARRQLLVDWLVRTASPMFLSAAGAEEAAQRLRNLPPGMEIENVSRVLSEVRDEAYEARSRARARLRAKFPADAADAYAAAYAAAAAAADAYAAAYAAAAAAADAYAAAAAAYAAAAAADAYAAAYDAAYAAAAAPSYKQMYAVARAAADERLAAVKAEVNASVFVLLDQLVDPAAAAQ